MGPLHRDCLLKFQDLKMEKLDNRYFYPNLRVPAIARTLPASRSGVLQDSTPYLIHVRRFLAIPAACEPPGDVIGVPLPSRRVIAPSRRLDRGSTPYFCPNICQN